MTGTDYWYNDNNKKMNTIITEISFFQDIQGMEKTGERRYA